MINIEIKNAITSAKIISEPDDWKLLIIREGIINIPGTFFKGSKWTLYFNCSSCGKGTKFGVYYQSPEYLAAVELHYHSFNNKNFLNLFGNLFQLDLVDEGADVNNKIIFFYQIKNNAAWLSYFKCNHCKVQYLMTYSKQFGEERPPQPDLVHIKGIYQVEFNEEEFFRLYNEYEVKKS